MYPVKYFAFVCVSSFSVNTMEFTGANEQLVLKHE